MKYNPRVNEDVARLAGIAHVHPLQPDETAQGALRIMFELQNLLAAITGFSAATLQPAAGAQGELAGMLMMRAYHLDRGDGRGRKARVAVSSDRPYTSKPYIGVRHTVRTARMRPAHIT